MRHPVLQAAVDDVRATFPDHVVSDEDLPDGSVWLTVQNLALTDKWSPTSIDLSVKVPTTFPANPPYPFYAAPGLTWTVGPCAAVTDVEIDGVARSQISLMKAYDPATENLGTRLLAVRHWMRSL